MEGSILAQANKKEGSEEDTYSLAAVLAYICTEYSSFGREAFVKQNLKYLILEIDSKTFIARPVYNLILCFVCDKQANTGLVRNKIDKLA